MRGEKRTIIRFPFFYENEKQMNALKNQSEHLLNMKMINNPFSFVFHFEVKIKSNHKFLNFVFQFIKNTK